MNKVSRKKSFFGRNKDLFRGRFWKKSKAKGLEKIVEFFGKFFPLKQGSKIQ